MSISSTTRKAGPFTGNDVTTVFPFSFKVFSAAELLVVRTTGGVETTLVLNSTYSVTLNANQDTSPGGNVTLTTALATNYTLTITSAVAQTQPVVLANNGGFYPTVINNALDRLTILVQQLAESASRSVKIPLSSSAAISTTLPVPAASKLIGWNSAANALQNVDVPAEIGFIPNLASTSDNALGDALIGFKQSNVSGFAAGATARTVSSKLQEIVSVKDFGATGDGTTDDTAAIQAAIDYLQNGVGGTLLFPNGTYYITSTLTVGNGTTNVIDNTLAPVSLEGFGPVSGVGYASPANCAIIKSNVSGPAIKFQRNLGWGLKRFAFTFTTTSTTACSFQLNDVESGNLEDIVVLNCPGLVHTILYSMGTKNLTLNYFKNIYIFMGTSPSNAIGMHLNALAGGTSDVAVNTFEGLHIQPGLATHVGLYLGYCDTNTFLRYDFNPLPGFLAAAAAVRFDYTAHTSSQFPNMNHFFGGTVYTSPVDSIGTPAFTTALNNVWTGFDLGNNAPVPTAKAFTVDKLKLSADTTFYVNPSASGSGSFGPGDATSFGIYIGRPCLTAQQAYDQIAKYFDLNGYTATISGATGTYTSGIIASNSIVGGKVIFVGQGGGSVFNVTTGPIFSVKQNCYLQLQSINMTASSGPLAVADGGELAVAAGAIFGSTTAAHISAINGGLVRLSGTYYIIGNASSHYSATQGSKIVTTGATLFFLSNVTTTQFAFADGASNINLPSMAFTLGAYSATGSRYTSQVYSLIDTNGGGASYFPGSTAGTASTGTYR